MSSPAPTRTEMTDLDQLCINTIRTLSLDAVQKAQRVAELVLQRAHALFLLQEGLAPDPDVHALGVFGDG